MKKLNLFLMILIVNFTISKLHAQSASVAWTHVITASTSTTQRDAVKDDANRTYILRGRETIGVAPCSIFKITSTGTLLTSVTSQMDGRSLVVDNATGDVYVLGSIRNVAYNKLIFCVAKFNSTLTFQWSRTLDFNYGTSNANSEALKGVFANGNLYVAGYVNSGNAIRGEDWTVAKISPSGVWFLGFKTIQVAGNGRPSDCGFMLDNNGVPGFYVCGSTILPFPNVKSSILIKFDSALNEQWTRQFEPINGAAVNEWLDMEIFNYGIYLAGHSKNGPPLVPKAVWRVYTAAGLISGQFVYDLLSANTSKGLKIQIDQNLNVYLGLQKSIPVSSGFRQEAHVLRYLSTGPFWDQSIGNWGPIPSCTPPQSTFWDMSLNSTGQYIYLAGDAFDCSTGFSTRFPWVCKLATNIGNVIWFDSSPVVPDGFSESALKVFAVNENDCISTGYRLSVGTPDNVYARRYTTTIPRLASETIDEENINSSSASIQVFPNPVVNNLHISSESEIHKISIYDLAGSLIKEIDQKMIFEVDLDVSFLKPGVYMLMAATNEKQSFLKLVKQ